MDATLGVEIIKIVFIHFYYRKWQTCVGRRKDSFHNDVITLVFFGFLHVLAKSELKSLPTLNLGNYSDRTTECRYNKPLYETVWSRGVTKILKPTEIISKKYIIYWHIECGEVRLLRYSPSTLFTRWVSWQFVRKMVEYKSVSDARCWLKT